MREPVVNPGISSTITKLLKLKARNLPELDYSIRQIFRGSIHLGRMIFTKTSIWQSGFVLIEFPPLPFPQHHWLIMIRANGWDPFLVQLDAQT